MGRADDNFFTKSCVAPRRASVSHEWSEWEADDWLGGAPWAVVGPGGVIRTLTDVEVVARGLRPPGGLRPQGERE